MKSGFQRDKLAQIENSSSQMKMDYGTVKMQLEKILGKAETELQIASVKFLTYE